MQAAVPEIWKCNKTKENYLVLPIKNGIKVKDRVSRNWMDAVMYQRIDENGKVSTSCVYIREMQEFKQKFTFIKLLKAQSNDLN